MERKWWTLLAVAVAMFMLLLDITVVNVALPSIRDDLGGSFSDLQWVVDAYALTLAALVLTAGSLADRLGRRRLFAWGLGIFSAASLLCALAPDPTFLNLARAFQGIGGAVMFAVSLALLAQEFPAGSLPMRLPVLVWLAWLEGLGLLALPLGLRLFRRLPDRGFVLAKTVGLLLVAYLTWLAASLHLRTFALPDNVDETQVRAEFREGILNVRLPKTQKAMDLMTEAPSGVDARQLRELGIKLDR